MRAAQRVAEEVADCSARRAREASPRRPCDGAKICSRGSGDLHCRDRGEVSNDACCRVSLDTQAECPAAYIGTAYVGILILAAFAVAWCERRTTAPVACAAQLPSANQQVFSAASAAHVLLAFTERQSIHEAGYERVIPVSVVWTVGEFRIVCIAAFVVVVRTRISVVAEDLKSLREPLFYLDLKRVVTGA